MRVKKEIKRKKESKKTRIAKVSNTSKKSGTIILKKKSPLESIRREITRRIQQKQAYLYPPIAIRNGVQGITIITFKIQPNGSIQKISVQKSSGNTFLDRASLEAVSTAAPFPYLKDPLKISIRWKLEN
ncbi:MAG: energy transducer TonB [Nitrospinota bacterium]|nr:energy transducer TonB [Nitrospinota bacterium]